MSLHTLTAARSANLLSKNAFVDQYEARNCVQLGFLCPLEAHIGLATLNTFIFGFSFRVLDFKKWYFISFHRRRA
ncbi:unnamed protein product [Calypogeia fissa]